MYLVLGVRHNGPKEIMVAGVGANCEKMNNEHER